MANTTFWDVIERTLEKVGTPLTPNEIWEKANELNTLNGFTTEGKTPWATIAAYCYTDLNKNGDDSLVVKVGERPTRFFLRRLLSKVDLEKAQKQRDTEVDKKERQESARFNERDIHALLVAYAFGNANFRANVKTIFHENSSKGRKGQNEWLHPDLVGVFFPFGNYEKETLEIQKSLSVSSIKLFSFEVKVALTFGNLRQSYFQAVSNSSWANEGYLVALKVDDDLDFRNEIARLNNAFGIGVIQLNGDNPFESEILFPSKISPEIDWDTVDRLAKENQDFNGFLRSINEDWTLKRVKSQYDKVLKPEELTKYLESKGISKRT